MHLEAENAPACIKAHCLFAILLPKLIVRIGIDACATEMTRLFAGAICGKTGQCFVCHKVPADGDDLLCAKCRAECDQYRAAYDEPDGEELPE